MNKSMLLKLDHQGKQVGIFCPKYEDVHRKRKIKIYNCKFIEPWHFFKTLSFHQPSIFAALWDIKNSSASRL